VIDSLARSFDIILTLTNGGPGFSTELMNLRIYRLAFKFSEIGYASAVSWPYLLKIMLLSMLLIRFLAKSAVIYE